MGKVGMSDPSLAYVNLGPKSPPVSPEPQVATPSAAPETTTPIETTEVHDPHQTQEHHGATTGTQAHDPHASHHSGVSLLLRPNLQLQSDFGHTFLGKVGTDFGVQSSFGKGYHFEGYGIANFQTTPGGSAFGLGGGAHLEKLFGQANQPGGNTFLGLIGHGEYAFALGNDHGHGGHGPAAPSGAHLELEVEAGRQWNVGNHGSNFRLFGIGGAEYSHGHIAPQAGAGASLETGKFEFTLDAKVNPLAGFSVPPTVGFSIAFKPFGSH